MAFRLKLSKRTSEIFEYIYLREHLQPFALVKISIALSIKNKYRYMGEVEDSLGQDLNRQTITGDYDLLYKKLIEMNEEKSIPEDDYLTKYVKAYIDNGAKLLEQEYKYTKDIYKHLVQLDKGI